MQKIWCKKCKHFDVKMQRFWCKNSKIWCKKCKKFDVKNAKNLM